MAKQLIFGYNLSHPESVEGENPDFLTKQLITYIGNKRNLLDFINSGISEVQKRLGKKNLKLFDVFSGSGVVARYLKQYSEKLIVNDLEKYSEIINRCYLANYSSINMEKLKEIYSGITDRLKNYPLEKGFIHELYAPRDDFSIQPGERVFYTSRNAMFLDTARKYIEAEAPEFRHFLLAPLLSEASVHANTAGVFKGFYKNRGTGIGRFGGKNGDALNRIKGDIHLPFPVFSNFECQVEIHRGDSIKIVREVEEVDVAYLDPPYNQHPYGSNYFMLNLLADYKRPVKISRISGIPTDWNRSAFNSKREVILAFSTLIKDIKAKFLLVSFNSDGYISLDEMLVLLKKVGKVTVFEQKYNTFRGSRNLKNRAIHVKEYLYLVEKK